MSTPSVNLTQDTQTSLGGINLKWAYTALSTIKEVSLIYFQNVSDADIVSVDIASGLTRYNIPNGFVSGQSYSYQLQVVDISGTMVFSNTLVFTAPWFLLPPVISSVSGSDQSLDIQLQSTSNILSAPDTVEFVLKRDDNVVFWIIKTYSSSGAYTLSNSDNASLANNMSYRVACMYQPSSSNTRYIAPSAMSNSISATPSNLPNAPSGVSSSSVGTSTLDMKMVWTRPSDFSDWSSAGFSIVLSLGSSYLYICNSD